ncbi:MAG: FtsX-like permease family protein [Reichenbachiella sp.]|uniref:ABC transporter permease n=1 Tax=Reichenbachiella sp. TaxID=2184521 RepID=UPI0032663CA1
MSVFKPPNWMDRLLVRLCPNDLLEEIQGDLHEAFVWRCKNLSVAYAKRKFLLEVLMVSKFYKPKMMKNSKLALLNNYLKTGLRFLWKTRKYAGINIIGLTVGITVCWMCFFYLYDEMTFDRFNKNRDRLYRVTQEVMIEGDLLKFDGGSYIMGEVFPANIPQIDGMSRFKSAYGIVKMNEENMFQYMHFADADIFRMLDFNILEGSYLDFGSPDNILISARMARTLNVGLEEITIHFRNQDKRFNIIGIYQDLPHNSTVRPKFILPFAYYATRAEKERLKNWHDFNMNALIMLKDAADKGLVEAQMTALATADAEEGSGEKMTLQPYSQIHLDTTYRNGNGLRPTADMDILWIAGIVGLLCLLISAINYSNFSLGNYIVRSKEVAVRKVIGAHQQSVFSQFICESFLSTTIAAIVSLLLLLGILPFFAEFMNKGYLTFEDLFQPDLIIGGLSVLLVITLIAGLYPAIVLSGFKVNDALRGKEKIGKGSLLSRFYLTIQFGLAIFLIIGMLAATRQFDYLIDFDLGYEDENVVTLGVTNFDKERLERFEAALSAIPGVQRFASNSGYNGTDFVYQENRYSTRHIVVSPEFVPTLGIEILQGRNFDPDLATDINNSVIVNETLVKMLGLPDPLGTVLPFSYGEFKNPTIIGVVKDFHFYSPKYEKMPLVMYQSPQYVIQNILVKLDASAGSDPLYHIEKAWREAYDPYPFEVIWLNDHNEAEMAVEERVKKIATTGSLIAVFLAALGLMSMVGTHVNQRMKEISIRKISGASPAHLYGQYARKFAVWIVGGFVLGCLPAYYYVSEWLDDYPSRIELSWDFALIALGICTMVFVTTLVIQLTKVIRANPVVFLRDE